MCGMEKNKMIVEGKVECDELGGIKRMYLPGIILKATCQCGNELSRDMRREYVVQYPAIGKPFIYTWCCGECENEWDVSVQLDITLTVQPEDEQCQSLNKK